MGFFLTKKQLDDYHKNGFLILKDHISEEWCQSLMMRASDLVNDFNPGSLKTIFSTKDQRQAKHKYFLESGDKVHFFFEEGAVNTEGELLFDKAKSINKIGHALHDLDPIFKEFSNLNEIQSLIHDLNITDPIVLQSMYICKQPKIGGEVLCHQDATYLYAKKIGVVGLWFALENATLENGCLWAIPGGHKHGLKSRFCRAKDDSVSMEIFNSTPWDFNKMIPLEVSQGSVIVLHGYTPHMSKVNNSSRSRHAYTLHFMSAQDDYADDNWLRRNL